MKTTILVTLLAACALVTGCDKKEGGDKGDKAASADTGNADCDAYFKKFEDCKDKMPEASKAAMEQGVKSTKQAFDKADAAGKTAMAESCKQGMKGLEANCK